MQSKKAVVLISGGLDSATTLAMASQQGYECYAISFDYGQRAIIELESAKRLANQFKVAQHKIIKLNIGELGGSALTDQNIAIPDFNGEGHGVPITYVPARNTVFLSIALGWAEILDAHDIFIGVTSQDYSGYPDCRPEYIKAFEAMANLATKAGIEGNGFRIQTPLMYKKKSETITTGIQLGVDYSKTVTCYQPDDRGQACGHCDSCSFRRKGFEEAGIADPTHYQSLNA